MAQNADYEKLSTRLKPAYGYFRQMGRGPINCILLILIRDVSHYRTLNNSLK